MVPRGGKRVGAGRPKGQGKYQEPTNPMRVPESLYKDVLGFIESKGYKLPLYSTTVQAGFPSPADDYLAEKLDLNHYLIKNPSSTFLLKAAGDSMINAGIYPGDILIVDRSLDPKHGKIIIAAINGELTVKRLHKHDNKIYLNPENDTYKPIEVKEESDFLIWGVVAHVLHAV